MRSSESVYYCLLTSELLGSVGQHLLVSAVDLDLGGADDSERDALGGVDPVGPDLQGHGVEGQPLDGLDTGEDQRPPAHDVLGSVTLE